MDMGSGRIPRDSSISQIGADCGLLQKYCEEIGLPMSAAALKRLIDGLSYSSEFKFERLRSELIEIHRRVYDELESRQFFVLDQDTVRYFSDPHFSATVFERFPETSFDAVEAGKCLTLERSTACVFHLMRVSEHGLRAVADFLKISDPLGPNWDQIIKKIDSELKADYSNRKFKGQVDLLSHISTHIHALKLAWRNPTMHIDKKHTQSEARDIYNATSALMNYLADSLPKKSGIIQAIRGMMNP